MSGLIRLSLFCAFAFVLLVAAACAAPAAPNSAMQAPAPEVVPVEPGVLAVTNVFARPSPMQAGNGAVYLTVLNGLDQPLQLTSATSNIAMAVELHETINDQGVMRMEPRPDGFAIPALAKLELQPGGKHIMLIDLAKPLVTGEVFTLTLNFDNADALAIEVPVTEGAESNGNAHADADTGARRAGARGSHPRRRSERRRTRLALQHACTAHKGHGHGQRLPGCNAWAAHPGCQSHLRHGHDQHESRPNPGIG